VSITDRLRECVLTTVFLTLGAVSLAACATDAPTVRDAETAAGSSTVANAAEGSERPSPAAQSSGIKGVVLRGPLAGGPLVEGRPSEAPFKAKFFVDDTDGNRVAEFDSDDEGRFELDLPPGDYVIVPEPNAPVFRPAEQPQAVTVPEGRVVELTLRYDTGMR
jgi:hypothetical protein